jgi:hypothetical protein
MSKRKCTAVDTLFTFCPPAPWARIGTISISLSEITMLFFNLSIAQKYPVARLPDTPPMRPGIYRKHLQPIRTAGSAQPVDKYLSRVPHQFDAIGPKKGAKANAVIEAGHATPLTADGPQ